jgi:hypothetical protein
MTQELRKRFEQVGRQEDVEDPIVIAKFFNPSGAGTWLATEFYPEDGLFFGYASIFRDPMMDEWGYFSLAEFENTPLPPFGLKVERDLYWEECPFSEAKRKERLP